MGPFQPNIVVEVEIFLKRQKIPTYFRHLPVHDLGGHCNLLAAVDQPVVMHALIGFNDNFDFGDEEGGNDRGDRRVYLDDQNEKLS